MLSRLRQSAARLDRRVLPALAGADTVLLVHLVVAAAVLRCTARRVAPAVVRLAAALAVPAACARALLADRILAPPARAAAPRRAASPRQVAAAAASVLLAGLAGLAATAPAPAPRVAVQATAVVQDRPGTWSVRLPDAVPAPTEARPAPPDLRLPRPAPSRSAVPPAPVAPAVDVPPVPAPRWLPTGTGMWVHEWTSTEGGDPQAVVRRAQAAGVTHVFVQTGSTKKGWIGEEVLGALLPATDGTGLGVVAWDFPTLLDPEGDARRLVQAARWERPGVPRVAAVAPDVETAAEGTAVSADAVQRYYATLRAELPAEVAVLATVPWPSERRTASYPYAQTAALSDALIPMAYWYNRAPEVVTATSMQWLAQFGLPVMPVGQGFDGRLDAPYLPEDPDPGRSVQAFLDAARAGGARSVSLWSWQTTGPAQWDVLTRAAQLPWR